MAKRNRNTQEPEPDPILNDKPEEIDGEALEPDALALVQEESMEESEEEEWTEEVPVREPVEWYYLTSKEREEHCDRVRVWLGPPSRVNARQMVSDLWDLAVDNLVGDAFKRSYEYSVEAGAPNKREGEGWQKHLKNAEAAAASSAKICRDELAPLVHQDKNATRAVLVTTMKWWLKERRAGKSSNLDFLQERCGDQLAAVLVLKNLPPAEHTKNQIWWGILLHRFVQRIILPRLGGPVSEDSVNDCILAILKRAKDFTYPREGKQKDRLAKAITYFTNACRWKEPNKPPPPYGEPPKRPQYQLGREKLWSIMMKLGRDGAIKYWILSILKEDRLKRDPHQSRDKDEKKLWGEMADLALQPCCGILDDDDLPPSVAWDEVHKAFQAMAQRSRTNPGALTADALRQFHARASRELQQYIQEHSEAEPSL